MGSAAVSPPMASMRPDAAIRVTGFSRTAPQTQPAHWGNAILCMRPTLVSPGWHLGDFAVKIPILSWLGVLQHNTQHDRLGLPNWLHFGCIYWGKSAHGPTGLPVLSASSPVAAPMVNWLDANASRDFGRLARGQDILPTGDPAGSRLLRF